MEYEVTKNLVRFMRFELTDPQFGEVDAARGIDGRLYSPHGLGASLAMVPFFLCGEGMARLFPLGQEMRIHHFCISLMNPLLTALTCLMLYLFVKRVRCGERIALLSAGLYGLCTLAFPYSKVSFDVVLTAFLLVAATYAAFRFRQSARLEWTVLAGLLLGCAVLTRIATLIIVPLFALYLYFSLRDAQPPASRFFFGLSSFIIPIAVTLLIIGWYNTVRFGAFFEDGHATDSAVRLTTPVLVGFIGQLFSPGKGLFFYSPVLLFACVGLKRLYTDHRRETGLMVGIIMVNLLFHSKLVNWSGDWCWGPRFCVPLIPFLCIFLSGILGSGILNRKTLVRNLWIALVTASFLVQVLGVTIDGTRRIGRRYLSGTITSGQIYWHPAQSPIVDHARLLSRLSVNPVPTVSAGHRPGEDVTYDDRTADFWFVYLCSLGFPFILILGSVGVLIILDILCARVIVRSLRSEERAAC